MSATEITCWADRSFNFDPAHTALLVIDMQRHFLTEMEIEETAATSDNNAPGDEAETADAEDVVSAKAQADGTAPATADEPEDQAEIEPMDTREIIPRVVRLVDLARKLGCHVVHTREGYHPDMSDVSDFRRDLDYVGHETPFGRTLIRGEHGHDFVDELQPLPGETVIDKASFGAFYNTDLDEKLRASGVTHLILCGVTTQCCVQSTLREAVDRGYWCLTVADCCAASDQSLHDAALLTIMGEGHLFGWIADLDDIDAGASGDLVA